jgi:N-acetylmuramoyl-L-alanine amidase
MITTALMCMTLNIYFEARGEPSLGQIAVANVTLNRASTLSGDNKICRTVLARKQFSWTIKRTRQVRGGHKLIKRMRPKDSDAWSRALIIAELAIDGKLIDHTFGSIYYHTKAVNPYWAPGKAYIVADIGEHVFYKIDKSQVTIINKRAITN